MDWIIIILKVRERNLQQRDSAIIKNKSTVERKPKSTKILFNLIDRDTNADNAIDSEKSIFVEKYWFRDTSHDDSEETTP